MLWNYVFKNPKHQNSAETKDLATREMSVLRFSFFWYQKFTPVELCKLQLGINHSITAVWNKCMQKISGFKNIYVYNLNDYKIMDYKGPDHIH